jgi:hypothetical protein
MMTKSLIRLFAGIVLLIVMFWSWYWLAADYRYGAVSGVYTFAREGESSTLILKPDRSFQEELTFLGKVEHAQGSWWRFGEGGVVFSKQFLKLSGQETASDGESHGVVEKSFGLVADIVFGPNASGPKFRRTFFRRPR